MAVALAVGTVAVALAACSSSNPPTPSTTTGAAPSTAATTSSVPGSTSTTTATSTTAGSTACRTSSLVVTVGSPDGTAGAIHYQITFENTAATACTLTGYPGVSFLAAGGTQIGAPAQRSGSGSPTTTTVPAGGKAYSSVSVTDPGIPPCSSSATATQVRVYPPGQTQAALATAPTGMQVCSSPNTASYISAFVTAVSATAI